MKGTRGLLLLLPLCTPLGAGGECIYYQGTDSFQDINVATVVFEGVLERIEEGAPKTCEPDRLFFAVDQVWKGKRAKEYVLFRDSDEWTDEKLPDGRYIS